MNRLSDKALQLILGAEGLDQPGNWPGGQSGITIGIGYDLGYMRAIRNAVASGDLGKIANQLRAMKRLWLGKNLDGLLARREAEAKLVESSIA